MSDVAEAKKPSFIRPLLPVLLTVLLDLIGFGIVIPLLNFYAEEFGAKSGVTVTLLMACYSIAQFVFNPFWGALSDRIGRRPVMLVSIALTCLSLVGFASSKTLAMLFVFRTLNGAFAANISTAQACVADVTSPTDRARGMGLIGAAFGIGFTIGPAIGAGMSYFGPAAPFWFAAALAAINFVWALARLPETRRPGVKSHEGRSLDPRVWMRGLTHPVVGLAILLTFVATFAFAMMETTFGLAAAHAWGFTRASVGMFFFFIGVIGIVIQGGLIGRLSKRFGEARLVIFGYTCNALGMALLAGAVVWRDHGVSVPMRWFGAMFLALGSSTANPSLSSLVSRGAGADEQGAILGANQSLSALARATAPTVGGLLYDHWFGGGAFAVGAIMLALALPLAIPAVNRASRPAGG
jgi:DHA1 family tetracycline resistance protein-like MFS transporter